MAIVVVGGLLLSLVLTLLVPPVVAFILGYAIVVLGMRWYVERARAKRRDAFMDQLPDLARMLSNGTQAGLSIAGAVQMAARELDDPAGSEMAGVVQEMRLGQPLDRALERLQERLPSREVAVLMTTIVIQQRAGGDTVRALQELGATLEARKDLIREVRTVLSGSVFTSYVVAGIGIATIVLMNVFTPGVMREMTSSLPGLLALGRGRDVVGDRLRADPGVDQGGRVTVTPLLAGLLAAFCVTGALLSVPLLLDRGPVDRLAARTGADEHRRAPPFAAAAADRPARLAHRPAAGARACG